MGANVDESEIARMNLGLEGPKPPAKRTVTPKRPPAGACSGSKGGQKDTENAIRQALIEYCAGLAQEATRWLPMTALLAEHVSHGVAGDNRILKIELLGAELTARAQQRGTWPTQEEAEKTARVFGIPGRDAGAAVRIATPEDVRTRGRRKGQKDAHPRRR
jgi:hypothetical protein